MEFISKVQADKNLYRFLKYNKKETWLNFWYQIKFILEKNPQSVLEVGPGNKTVTNALKKEKIQVTTVDIDHNLKPDYIASVENLPFEDDHFDIILCSEVLEHLPYELFSRSLKELKRVTRKYVILGLPNAGGVFFLSFKIPIIRRVIIFFKLPFFWEKHIFNGYHYWETGKKGFQLSKIKKDIQSVGFIIDKVIIHYDDPAHCFFLLRK